MSQNTMKWKYTPPEGQREFQTDWNQTFVTALNVACLGRNLTKTPIDVKVPEKFRSLIESLLFYEQENNMIAKRYGISFISSGENRVYVENMPVEIVGYTR